jgi:S-adenosyl-L-methionine hydrolase (adenosine-forming)
MPSRTLRRKSRRVASPAPIAILTDFGYRDHYVGAMKGVIAGIAPDAHVIDITHGIPPQSVVAGAMALQQSWRFFPKSTVFLVVVDPGVGSTRKAIAIETRAGARFVGPDNGVISLAASDAGISRIVELREVKYRLRSVSSTFHGRDIFAPAAAWLSMGTPLTALGPQVKDITHLSIPSATRRADSIKGEVIYIDGFGNLVTNIPRAMLDDLAASFRATPLLVRIETGATMEIFQAYADAPTGAPLAILGSFEFLEIAIRDGSAASLLRLSEGAPVRVIVST